MEKTKSNTKKRILLTGASGTVGLETLKHLLKDSVHQITVFDVKTRKSMRSLAPFSGRIEIIYGDITDVQAIEELSKDKDVAIHLAAVIPPLADEDPELAYRVNVKGTENLILALEKNSPGCYLLFSSSISVYGDRLRDPEISVGDELRPSPGDRYGETKVLCEKIIQRSRLSWSIFRLSAIMGNHKLSKLMFHMPLETIMEICTPEDTGRAFAKAIAFQRELKDQIFNLGGGKDCVISYRIFLVKMFEAYGLGEPDFPEKAFAEKNFHCGIMRDGDKLENIAGFRQQTLVDHFKIVNDKIGPVQKSITLVSKSIIKRWLLSKSEPYQAYQKQNHVEMEHFFNNNELQIVKDQ